MALIYYLIVGAVAGWLAGQVMKGSGFGILGNIIIGIVGGFLGGWLLGEVLKVNISTGNATINYIVTALIGAVVLLFVAGLFRRK